MHLSLADLCISLFLTFVAFLGLQQCHFINSLNVDQRRSGLKTSKAGPQNYGANLSLKPKICPKNGAQQSARDSALRLMRLNGVKVGYVREMDLGENKIHRVVTRSLRPLLFEIPDFLSHKECDLLIQSSQERHFTDSETIRGKGEGVDRKEFERKLVAKNLTFEKIVFCKNLKRPHHDTDEDGKIILEEFIRYLDSGKFIHPTKEDASPMFGLLDSDSDGFVSYEECSNLTQATYVEFMYRIEKLKSEPRYFIRFSESTSLSTDKPIVKTLQRRIAKLTGLSRTLIENSEPIQVVRYSVYGHYNAHYDTTYGSGRIKECCRGLDHTDCHLCRFITIILYLNDVAKGGETAFPVADDSKRFHSRNYSVTLNEKCQEANLLIKPKKGKAVIWYNHLLEHDGDDHIGAADGLSLHGGCDVIEGVKWIANVWLNAPLKKKDYL